MRLRESADPAKKEWWERYLKGAIPFYGVPMGDIRRCVHAWAADRALSPAALRRAALELLRHPVAEEKLAGILIMQELLLPQGALDPDRDLPLIARVFDDGEISDWNTTDWLCVRVLGPLIAAGGRQAGEMIAEWAEAPGLWRRRCAAVAFVPLAPAGEAAFPGMVDMVLAVCASNVHDPERFAQTGVGWVLRELSDAVPDRVHGFVVAHRDLMSREAVRMAAARLSQDQRETLGVLGPRKRR
jgi:3-methyladenine DNA glycosylase AlkD